MDVVAKLFGSIKSNPMAAVGLAAGVALIGGCACVLFGVNDECEEDAVEPDVIEDPSNGTEEQ